MLSIVSFEFDVRKNDGQRHHVDGGALPNGHVTGGIASADTSPTLRTSMINRVIPSVDFLVWRIHFFFQLIFFRGM